MYCTCASPAGELGNRCAVCGEAIGFIVPVGPGEKCCPECGRRESYESMEFLKDENRCPGCGKK